MKSHIHTCKNCEKKFKAAHVRIHIGKKPYKCRTCNKQFTQSGHLKVHERIHTDEKPYACKKCNKQYCEPGHLKVHERIYSGGRGQS